jgi:hypothetical protein
MKVVIQFTVDEEAKALSFLLRHSPGTVLPNRTYIVERSVLKVLRDAGIAYQEITPRLSLPAIEEVPVGERI